MSNVIQELQSVVEAATKWNLWIQKAGKWSKVNKKPMSKKEIEDMQSETEKSGIKYDALEAQPGSFKPEELRTVVQELNPVSEAKGEWSYRLAGLMMKFKKIQTESEYGADDTETANEFRKVLDAALNGKPYPLKATFAAWNLGGNEDAEGKSVARKLNKAAKEVYDKIKSGDIPKSDVALLKRVISGRSFI